MPIIFKAKHFTFFGSSLQIEFIIFSKMDFEQLYSILPKPSITWTVSDIEIWL